MIKNGEYDLMTIAQIGHDPNTGRGFLDCMDEWEAERTRIVTEWQSLPWWRIVRNIQLRRQMNLLIERRGY